MRHEWVAWMHVHLDEPDLDEIFGELDTGGRMQFEERRICDAHVRCINCERDYTVEERRLPCDGPPMAYTRSGEPLRVRDN